jgi:hypothetical protein
MVNLTSFSLKLLDQPTIREHRRAPCIAKNMDYNNFDPNIQTLIKLMLLKRQQRANSIILHYTHEQHFSHHKQTIHHKWNDTFDNTPLRESRFIVGTRNNPNISKELIHKSPYIKKPNNNNKPTTN